MIKKLAILLLLLSLSVSFTLAEDFENTKKFGLGIMLGEPSGISGKYFLNSTNAIDFGLGYSIATNGKLNIHVDYLHHKEGVFNTNQRLILHYGFGAKIKTFSNSDDAFGLRGVIGITWTQDDLPFDAFIEIAPVFMLLPSTELEIDASIGARYYFDFD